MNAIKGYLFCYDTIADELEEKGKEDFIASTFGISEKEIRQWIRDDEFNDEIRSRLDGLPDKDITKLAINISSGFHSSIYVGQATGKIGTRVNVEYITFMDDDRKMKSAYYPKFEFDGSMVMIQDKTKPYNLAQFDTLQEALSFVKDYIIREQKNEATRITKLLQSDKNEEATSND